MNRLFTILCMVSLLVLHTSCNDSVMDLESPNVEMKTRAVEQRVQNLIQQARQGDVEAYYSLALCYRDGDGVEKSLLNMICMYAIYNQKTGGEIEDIIELFDEGHPFKLLTEIFILSSCDDNFDEKWEQLKYVAPIEAKAFEIAKDSFATEDDSVVINIMRELENEGSELAVMIQAAYYDGAIDETGKKECLTRIAEKYPFFNLLLGESYVRKYGETEDFSYIQKAIECYYKADAYGMLIPKYANALWGMYDYFGQKGMLEYDEQEVERLKVLAKRTY